ncbi:glycosyltransferase family 1 protein [Chengkuizengella sediminis]|nr:glycosyltransferase family 1 protein [Chengkuizengella sediminis]
MKIFHFLFYNFTYHLGNKDINNDNIQTYYSIPFSLYPECRIAFPNPVHIKKSIQQFNPTLVHIAIPFNMGLLGHHNAKKYNIPMVASYHTNFDQYLSYYKIQWMEPILYFWMIIITNFGYTNAH